MAGLVYFLFLPLPLFLQLVDVVPHEITTSLIQDGLALPLRTLEGLIDTYILRRRRFLFVTAALVRLGELLVKASDGYRLISEVYFSPLFHFDQPGFALF